MDWSWIPAAAQGTLDLGKFIYNIATNERDYDYQKSLQREVFNREDNAVQRRMEDLKAAGLNPNLAAGSAASSGAVVGRSVTPTLSGNPVGTVLDSLSAQERLKMERYENWKNEKERKLFDYQNKTDQLAAAMEQAQLWKMIGVDKVYIKFVNGTPRVYLPESDIDSFKTKNGRSLSDSPLIKQLDWQIQNQRNNADLLQKDVDWYTADKIIDAVGSGARAAGNLLAPAVQIMRYSRQRR